MGPLTERNFLPLFVVQSVMDLFLDAEAGKPLAQQLYEQLRAAIADGRLRPGNQLVPSRELADDLGVSRNTVTTAYGRLVAEGYAEGNAGGGSRVAPVSPARPGGAAAGAALGPGPRFAGWSLYFKAAPRNCRFDMRPGLPDPALFPAERWRRKIDAAAVAWHSQYGDPAGDIRLRRAIADWVARSRSVTAATDTVVITCGAQHAIDLVARILLEPGDTVAVEDPGYAPAARLFGALGARVAGVPVDDQGLVVERLPASARIVYVTPSHQFPLGMTMSMPRRRALLSWARQHDAAVIEDDYDTEFRYVGRPLEPLQVLDADGRVIYVGSFSKTFSPAVRLGFAVLPRPLVGPAVALRQLIDWHPPAATQAAMASFIEDGLLDKHIRHSRRVYAERHHIVTDALSGPLARHLVARIPNAGLHIAAALREGLGEDEVLRAAAARGIASHGLRDCFRTGRAQPGLLIGFGAVSTADLPAALRTLHRVLTTASSPPRAHRHTRPETGLTDPG